MTRAQVLIIGLLVFLLGGGGYLFFLRFGFDESFSGIAAETVLILILLSWIGSYFFRVITGNMTFNEQRKRYRKAYDEITKTKLQEKFDSLPEDEQIRLMKELEE